jgi:hypothetical protein
LDVERFFIILKDGALHNVSEIAAQTEISTDKLAEFCQFLSKEGMAQYEEETRRIKIEPAWKDLIPEEEPPTAPKTVIATVIIPPETTVYIQSALISNISKIELEVTLRMNGRIQEVLINV